jgi:hypothetical protein
LCDSRKRTSQSDNGAFRGDDEDNTKEEEVYQDLCAIQNRISNRREQVAIYKFCYGLKFLKQILAFMRKYVVSLV